MEYKDFIDTISTDDFGGYNAIEYADGGLEYYVSVQAVLKWIGEYANLISNKSEIIHIDWESDKPMFTYSTTLSCNLEKCYIRNGYLGNSVGTFSNKTSIPEFKDISVFKDPKYTSLNLTLKEEAGTVEDISIYPQVGNINYIYLSTYYLSQLITKGSDNRDNKITIRKFLQDICDAMNKALGSINDFQVISNPDGAVETLTIVDYQQKRIKGLAAKFKETGRDITTLQTQGLGTMLTKIQAQSSITPELAAMIAIGAQAQNQPVGEEAASFSLLSRGLIDRIYPSKTVGDTNLVEQEKERKEAIESDYKQALSAYARILENQQPTGDSAFNPVSLKSTEVSNLQNIAVDLYKACLGMFTETGQTSTAFIPIKVNLSLYGIAGIKIYQKFKLSNNVLPLSYKGNFEFIVLGVSHTVDSSRWETNISALITLADEPLKKDGPLKPFSIRAEDLIPSETGVVGLGSQRTRGAKRGIKCNTITKTVNSFDAVLKLVIDNLEGSYAKGGLSAGSANSGETLWGLDRKNHKGKLDDKFWASVDKTSKKGWNNSTFPKPKDAPALYKLYVPILKKDYNSFKKGKNKDVIKVIEGDGRLFFHMVYAVFNGAGWFNGFYKIIEQAYTNGTTSAEELLKISVNERITGGYNAYRLGTGNSRLGQGSATLLANTGVDIEKLVGLAPECQTSTFSGVLANQPASTEPLIITNFLGPLAPGSAPTGSDLPFNPFGNASP